MAYVLAGGIKELEHELLPAAAGRPDRRGAPARRPGRTLLAIPIALAATFASLSLTTVPWIGVLGAGVLLTVLVFQGDRVRVAARVGAQIAALAFVLSLPTLGASSKLLPLATGPGLLELGNLSAPVPGDHGRRRLDQRRLPLPSAMRTSFPATSWRSSC